MGYEVIAERSFERDYEAVVDYLENTLHSPQSAWRLISAVRHAGDLIGSFPAEELLPFARTHQLEIVPKRAFLPSPGKSRKKTRLGNGFR